MRKPARLASSPPPWGLALRDARHKLEMPSISAVVHARTAEQTIGQAIESLAWVDEVVVIDDYSPDGTAELARALGANVCHRQGPDLGLMQTHGDWLLLLLADERISEQLAKDLTVTAASDEVDLVELSRATLSGTGGGDFQVRFLRRTSLPWSGTLLQMPNLVGRKARLDAQPVQAGLVVPAVQAEP